MNTHKQAVFTLLGLTILFLAILFLAYRFKLPTEFTVLVGGSFSSFSGALLLALKTDSGIPANGNGNGSPKVPNDQTAH